jgi:hypothetical protein
MAAPRAYLVPKLIARLLLSLLLVFATYNPSGYSAYHWLFGPTGPVSLKLAVLVAFAGAYYAAFRIVFSAFRWSGLIAALATLALFGLAVASGGGEPDRQGDGLDVALLQYALLIAVSVVMAVGLTWSYLIERLTGQLQKRYVR